MERYRVVRLEEQMYGCEELPEGAEVCCDVTVEAADGTRKTLSCPDAELSASTTVLTLSLIHI